MSTTKSTPTTTSETLPQVSGWILSASWFPGYDACPEGYYPAEPARWKYNASRLDGGPDGGGCFICGAESLQEARDFIDENGGPC